MNDKSNPVALFSHTLDRQEPQFRVALPKNIDPLRYIRILRTAVNSRPDLLRAATGTPQEQNSFWVAVMKAAASGLVPDGREGFINVYNTNLAKKGEKPVWSRQCEWQPMIYGIYKQLRANPAIHSAYAHVVRANDYFEYELGDEPKIVHRPSIDSEAPIMFAYAVVKLANGQIEREVMSKAQIETVRAKSKAHDSLMWTDFYDQGCCKAVMRRLAKRIPAVDESMFDEEEETLPPYAPPAIKVSPPAQIAAAGDLPEPPLPDDPVYPEPDAGVGDITEEERAHTRGFADAMAGMERKAVPPEYRGEGKTHLASIWLAGWLAGQPQQDKGD